MRLRTTGTLISRDAYLIWVWIRGLASLLAPILEPHIVQINSNSATVVMTEPLMIHEESATAQEYKPKPQQPTSSRSTSASALLLNKLATRVTTLQCVDPLRALRPNSTTGDCGANSESTSDIICHRPTQENNTSVLAPDISDYWVDNIADSLSTPLNCLDLSNIILSPESAEYRNASDDGGVSLDTNIEYPLSDASSVPESNASEPTRSLPTTPARVLNNMTSRFASLRCIDELHDLQDNNVPLGQIQGDHSETTTTKGDGGLLAGDIHIDEMIFDAVGSPIFSK
ncbi:hypothetical protein PTKIN_Ptkin04bG0066700 [Pterospermum kingtungense]